MNQFRSIFIIAAQTALLSCANSLCASTSTCDIDWSDVVGLRVDVPNGCCPYADPNCEGIDVEPMSDDANLQGGSECGEYVLAVTVDGRVEDQDEGFDYVYVNGTLFFSGRDGEEGCDMYPAGETRQITVKADDPIVLTYDRVDNLYNDGAYAEITKISLISGPGCNDGACSTCGGAGGGSAGNSSVDVRVSLGDADVEEIRDGNEAIRQVLTSQVLADVVTLSARKYEIRFYYAADAGSQSGGLYQPTGTPYKVWTFEDPDNGTGSDDRLKVTESSGGSDTVHEYTWIPGNQDWTLVSGSLKEIGRAKSTVGSDRVETYWVKAPGGSDTYRRETTYQTFAWGEEKVAETLDPQNPSGERHAEPIHPTRLFRRGGRPRRSPRRVGRPAGSFPAR